MYFVINNFYKLKPSLKAVTSFFQ